MTKRPRGKVCLSVVMCTSYTPHVSHKIAAHSVLRTAIGEVGTSAEQTHLMLALSVAVACGFTLGPIIGGVISDPCSRNLRFVPLCHDGELFASK